jgi:putative flippase GtrA
MTDKLHGWHPDPYGVHELRYFALNGEPTRLVRDADSWSHHIPDWGTPPATPTSVTPVTPVTPVTSPTARIPEPALATPATPATPARTTRLTLLTSPRVPARSYAGPRMVAPSPRLEASDPFDYQPEVGFLAEGPWLPDVDPEIRESSRRALAGRFLRYGSVTAISTAVALLVLGVLVGGFSFPAIWANLVATVVATVPFFELNRRWVWAHDEEQSIWHQAIPYAICSIAGLVVSTFAVHLASNATALSTRVMHTVAVELAVLGSYIAIWLVQFVLCDRIFFRSSTTGPELSEWTESDAARLLRQPILAPAHA